MSTEKARGVVIRETAVGESDKIITLLTKEMGKITLSARGARKPKSKYLASCELFAYSDFVIYTARKYPSVSSAELINSFYGIRKRLDCFYCGAYLAEICNSLIYEGTDCSDIMLLFITALNRMSKGLSEPFITSLVFELKFLYLNGMLPDMGSCCVCGRNIEGAAHIGSEGLICDGCGGEEASISAGAVRALGYIYNSDIPSVFSFRADERVVGGLSTARDIFFREQTDRQFRTYDMFRRSCSV